MEPDGAGIRKDDDKPKWDLMPFDALNEVVLVFTYGALKYENRNWERGMPWSKVISPLLRHTWKFIMGEKYDKESKCHHMAHVACNALFLLTYDIRPGYEEFDDRVKILKDG